MSVSLSSEYKRLRFSADDDLCLLKEVLGQNPLENPGKWHTVQSNIKQITGKEFLVRTLKDHLCLLLSLWKKKTEGDQIRSGIEEIYSEKDRLLQEISDLCRESEGITPTKKRKISKEKQIIQLGRQTRDQIAFNISSDENVKIVFGEHDYVLPTQDSNVAAQIAPNDCLPSTSRENNDLKVMNKRNILGEAETLNIPKEKDPGIESIEKRKILGPVKTRKNKSVILRKNALEYLNKKNEKEHEIKQRELRMEERRLDLEERKIIIEEKKLELEVEDRKNRHDLEIERIRQELLERKEVHRLIESQQRIIDTLLLKLPTYGNS